MVCLECLPLYQQNQITMKQLVKTGQIPANVGMPSTMGGAIRPLTKAEQKAQIKALANILKNAR